MEMQKIYTNYRSYMAGKYLIDLLTYSYEAMQLRISLYYKLITGQSSVYDFPSTNTIPEERNVSVTKDINGNELVVINDIRFKGKRSIDWKEVETYLKRYVGKIYKISETKDLIYIGTDFPDEYAHSEYTNTLRGANAKAKANVVSGIPEMIEIATNKKHTPNVKKKHDRDAKYGWYRYESRFAAPVFDDNHKIIRYNTYRVIMVIRHADDGKKYIYDIMNIKKETSNLFTP